MCTLTDQKIYEHSLMKLVENLNNNIVSSDSDIVIALSRKGPRLLEYLRKAKGLRDICVMTEHAMPFLFERLAKNKGHKVRLHIVDDAIYFGSTILALKEEIQTYIELLSLNGIVEIAGIYACIKDVASLDFGNIQLFADSSVRSGYGHYYVKQVMKDLRSLGKSLEVEFPAIDYSFDKTIDFGRLYEALSQSFGSENVYKVESPVGIKSISILLSKVEEPTFRKLRLFVNGTHLSIVSIAPELTKLNIGMYPYFGFGNLMEVNQCWRTLANQLVTLSKRFDEKGLDMRNVVKTGAVLLNYFSSVDTFCYYRSQIESVFQELFGDILKRTLDDSNLFYLLGDKTISQKVKTLWNKALDDPQYSTIPYNAHDIHRIDNIVCESTLLYNKIAGPLDGTNFSQLQKCHTLEQALSSMFFNQTLMIERWSRASVIPKQERLRFGYTYQYLWNFIWGNAHNIDASLIQAKDIHRWVDTQIDNGSIVPQYVIDKNLSQWVRVFRPGENEDLVISHLGRLVVHVIQRMNSSEDDSMVGKVIKKNLDGVLSVIFHKFKDKLQDEEGELPLRLDRRKHVLYLADTQDGLIDYLVGMNILSFEDNKFIRVNPQIEGREFSSFTTISDQLISSIDDSVGAILNMMGNRPQASYTYSNTINYFLYDLISQTQLQADIDDVSDYFENAVRKLISGENISDSKKELVADIVSKYTKVLSCYEMTDGALILKDSILPQTLKPILWKVRKMANAVNIFILLCYKDKKAVCDYLEKLNPMVVGKMEVDDILSYLQGSASLKEDLSRDKVFLYKLIAYIRNK